MFKYCNLRPDYKSFDEFELIIIVKYQVEYNIDVSLNKLPVSIVCLISIGSFLSYKYYHLMMFLIVRNCALIMCTKIIILLLDITSILSQKRCYYSVFDSSLTTHGVIFYLFIIIYKF